MIMSYPHVDLYRRGDARRPVRSQIPRVFPEALHLVTAREMEALCDSFRQGRVPLDLRAKLDRLRADDPKEFYLKRQSELLIAFLIAPGAADYCRVRPDDCQRLLRMLAYVRKDDDAIPDTLPEGFVDDHDLMRMTCNDLRRVLDSFKAWHLSRRVAQMWKAQR